MRWKCFQSGWAKVHPHHQYIIIAYILTKTVIISFYLYGRYIIVSHHAFNLYIYVINLSIFSHVYKIFVFPILWNAYSYLLSTVPLGYHFLNDCSSSNILDTNLWLALCFLNISWIVNVIVLYVYCLAVNRSSQIYIVVKNLFSLIVDTFNILFKKSFPTSKTTIFLHIFFLKF